MSTHDMARAKALGEAASNILKVADQGMSQQPAKGLTQVDGVTDGVGPNALSVQGTNSQFNPFFVFRYAKYGTLSGEKYDPKYHLDNISTAGEGGATSGLSLWGLNTRETIENPSATKIIEWARDSADNSNGKLMSPVPYSVNDFLYCKWYGKIPNNRLLTLRRYPIPVEDNLQVNKELLPLVPIAQAVTWWGDGTNNKLSNLLSMTYGFNWSTLTSDVQTIEGNEISLESLLDTATSGILTLAQKKLLTAIISNDPAAASGQDKVAQNWLKEAWGNEGQYWNRVLGPVNVINKTQKRDRGYTFDGNIELKFTYSLRSYGTINPRIALLDIISNFLSLTYNEAEFWGGAARVFEKPGFTVPGLPTDKLERLNPIEGSVEILKFVLGEIYDGSKEAKTFLDEIFKKLKAGNIQEAFSDVLGSRFAKNIAGAATADLIPKPQQIKSILDGRAVGEWHLTVGNPMNPIAVIGNLCMKKTKIEFSEALGLDDFPTEVTFTVNLEPGRPRAKQDIESMFNLGNGAMYFSALPPPSSARDAFGEVNSNSANAFRTGNQLSGDDSSKFVSSGQAKQIGQFDDIGTGYDEKDSANSANFYAPRVRELYGEKFSQSKALVEYFLDRKTKGG